MSVRSHESRNCHQESACDGGQETECVQRCSEEMSNQQSYTRDERRMVEITNVRMTGIVPVIRLLWEQFHELAKLKVDCVYVAMFDEVDEGTAIFKVTRSRRRSSKPPLCSRNGATSRRSCVC